MDLRGSAGRRVGRDDPLGRLLTVLDDAEGGRSVVALVSGDAGVGKTRLVRGGGKTPANPGCPLRYGQCAELGAAVPYLPLADALRGPTVSSGVRAALASRSALGRLLPEGSDGE